MKVDEYGNMEVMVDGRLEKRRAEMQVGRAADWLCRDGSGLSRMVPEVRCNERLVEMLDGTMHIVKVSA